MAAPIKLFENRAILFKKETAYGTDPTPTGAANALLSFEGSCSYEADELERKQDLPYHGADPFVLVNKRGTVEFTFDMLGAAVAGNAAPIAPVLLACAHAETLIVATSAAYNPVSSNYASGTIYFYHAGLLFKIKGARGTIDWEMSIKDWGKGKAKFTGLITLADVTEVDPGALTLTAFRTPPAIEMETLLVTVGGVAVNANKFQFSQNATATIYEGSEAREVSLPERKPNGTLTIFADSLAAFNPWQLADAMGTSAIVVEVDGGATKKAQLTIGQAQLKVPKLVNIDGAAGWELGFNARPLTGGDEYSWLFT
jgi:hypothetical protein